MGHKALALRGICARKLKACPMYDCIAQTEVKNTIADSFTDGKSQYQNKLF